jgi:hypothetical protein
MIGRDGNMRNAILDHPQQRLENPPDRSNFATVLIARRWQSIVVPEQLVGAVDQINVQSAPPGYPA